jgi:GT2 family glycosyltransferase
MNPTDSTPSATAGKNGAPNSEALRESRRRVSARLSDLFEAKRRLARLRNDYAIIERSKFSRLRSAWLIFKSLFGLAKRDRFAAISSSAALAAVRSEELLTIELPPAAGRFMDVAEAFRRRTPRETQRSSEPTVVSVIIPVYNQTAVTMRCLRSIADTWFDTLRTEIIVIDDCSNDETAVALATIPGITVIRNHTNQGFIRSCNRGAAIASGRYLCFLNNDTEVGNAWLDYLVSTADADPLIGAVGAKLVYPDGRLQESGNIIWRDGSGWNYGRNDDPADPLFNFVREVDYCSGACLLVRTELFNQVGGFSKDLIPAYYEDVDLCFALREIGYKVVVDPRSVIVHYEGASSGTSTASGTKKYQEINRPKFENRWRHALAAHYENDPASVYKAARRLGGHGKTILVIDSYVPFYDREAGSMRLFEIIKMFRKANYRVVFQPDNWTGIEPYTSELQALGVEVVYHVEGKRTPEERIREMLPSVDIAWVSRPEVCEKWLPALREHSHIHVLYDTVDLHHLRLRRQAELEGTTDAESWFAVEALELKCAESSDGTVTVTLEEKATLEASGIRPVYVVPTIHTPRISEPRSFENANGLLFIGGYAHSPNVDAVEWLCSEIMPLVWRTIPGLRVTLLGNNPTPSVLALRSNRVDVPGYIADVEPYFLSHRIFVAPLRYGAGIKGKVGHAMSYGLPTITTQIGAEGFRLRPGQDYLEAETAAEFATTIVRLDSDPELWSTLSENSLRAMQPFSSEAVTETLLRIIDSATERGRAGVR